jgi:hypothetical protein
MPCPAESAESLSFRKAGGQTHGLVTHGSPIAKGDVVEEVAHDAVYLIVFPSLIRLFVWATRHAALSRILFMLLISTGFSPSPKSGFSNGG